MTKNELAHNMTLDDIMAEYDKERIAEIERDEADPITQARRSAKKKAEMEREIRQGLRDDKGDWIEVEQPEDSDEDEDEDEDED